MADGAIADPDMVNFSFYFEADCSAMTATVVYRHNCYVLDGNTVHTRL